ncbi:hypothetical protein Hdeb2414_s0024g00651561 [Helianthus debilis subsp. tardiflorus]
MTQCGSNRKNGFTGRTAEDILEDFFGFDFDTSGVRRSTGFHSNDNKFRGTSDGDGVTTRKKSPPIENILPCSLEELYNGSTRNMKISRIVVDANGYACMMLQ